MYCGHMGVERPENWNFYLAFAFFRLAVMLQGRHRGSLAGEEPNQVSCALTRAHPGAQSCLPAPATGLSCLLLVLWGLSFPGRTEQRPKLGAQSCVLQMELSDLPAQHQPLPRNSQAGGESSRCSAHSRCGLGAFIRIKSDVIFTSLREEFPQVLLGWPRGGQVMLFGM